jgi:4'-phosphopantetheinyl transferase
VLESFELSSANNKIPKIPLRMENVDVWMVSIADVPDSCCMEGYKTVLTADERRLHEKFRFPKDRRRYLITRLLARYVLSHYVPLTPDRLSFKKTVQGRPYLADLPGLSSAIDFNISHSNALVIMAVASDRAVGVDVEDVQPNVALDIAENFFSGFEVAQLRSLPAVLQARRFFELWTLKESYVKAKGEGLAIPLDTFGFDLSFADRITADFNASLEKSPSRWRFWQWQLSSGTAAALCVENRADIEVQITVRQTIPFVFSREIDLKVARMSI